MMAYHVLHACIRGCTYTVMGDVSQNIHFGYGLNDWEALRELLLPDPADTFGLLKKSYRNTVEISDFATRILRHGSFFFYPVEPVLRHGNPVQTKQLPDRPALIRSVADTCRGWREKGWDTIAVICRSLGDAAKTAGELSAWLEGIESDPEKAVFGNGIMVLPVDYTKGLEFDAVLLLNPTREDYPVEDGHAKLLYVAATRALHELCILHTGNLTGLITDPVPEHPLPADKAPAANGPLSSAAPVRTAHTTSRKSAGTRTGTTDTTRAPHALSAEQRKSGRSLQRHAAHTPDRQNPALPKPENNAPVMQETFPEFGDMPATEILRPAGHGRIDLAVRWSAKQPDGLYLHSRYGVLRLSPVGSAIVRVTFAKSGQIEDRFHPAIAVRRTERTWMYKESATTIDLMTDELLVQTDKTSGAIRFMTRDKKLLFAERNKECRQLEGAAGGRMKVWLYPDWPKNETIYAMGAGETKGMNIRKTARYISHKDQTVFNAHNSSTPGQKPQAVTASGTLPFLLSEKGYGIVLAADSPVICCDLPTYGTYLCAEQEVQMDYYFIAGKRPATILNAYAYLCGKL